MSFNRIQKLLFSEYRDFEDMVLVESPFAQTTRDGQGVRQVHLGLTPTKLVLAVDVLPGAEDMNYFCDPEIDPLIESLELIAIYPVECVNLSVFRRRKRQSLKAHFCNNRISYFELGGFEKRTMFWNLWCERLKFLCPDDDKSLKSETSVATSTSSSTLRLLESSCKFGENGKRQIWLKYACNDLADGDKMNHPLFPEDLIERQFEIINCGEKDQTVTENKFKKSSSQIILELKNSKNVKETDDSMEAIFVNITDITTTTTNTSDCIIESINNSCKSSNMEKISECAVRKWELSKSNTLTKIVGARGRHPRRYAFLPQPHFLNGLGPWNLHPGERISVQMKRSVSAVRIRRQPMEANLCLPISKRLLTVSISCEAFYLDRTAKISSSLNKLVTPQSPLIYFWTPEYWYRPQSSRDAYVEYTQHSNKIKNYLDCKKKSRRKKINEYQERINDAKEFEKIFDNTLNFRSCSQENICEPQLNFHISSIQYLRRILKIKIAQRVWDFDSTCLAYQLTMIDKDLFMKISEFELQMVVLQRNSKNIPNIGSLIAFSHRISCLVVTEILREDVLKMRARLVVRFINIANKCINLNNYQSSISILNGLQSAPVYRLHNTWAHLRKYHSMKYLLFERMCRQYSDPRLPCYQRCFYVASKKSPFLPYIGDILAKLLDKSVHLLPEELEKFENNNSTKLYDNLQNLNQILDLRTKKREDCKSSVENCPGKQINENRILNFFASLKIWRSTVKENDKNNATNILDYTATEDDKRYKTIIDKDSRAEILQKTIEFLRISKRAAAQYALNVNSLAREYLLKARYREDRENFFNSFKLESKVTFF